MGKSCVFVAKPKGIRDKFGVDLLRNLRGIRMGCLGFCTDFIGITGNRVASGAMDVFRRCGNVNKHRFQNKNPAGPLRVPFLLLYMPRRSGRRPVNNNITESTKEFKSYR